MVHEHMSTLVDLSGLAAAFGVVISLWRIVIWVRKIDEEGDKKRARIYERLDEYKRLSDATFVRQDMCSILHKRTAEDIAEIKADVKLLVKNGNNKKHE